MQCKAVRVHICNCGSTCREYRRTKEACEKTKDEETSNIECKGSWDLKADKDEESKHVYRSAANGRDLLKGRENLFVQKRISKRKP